MVRYAVNASILLTDRPLLERPAAVRDAGFAAVEFWWPFATAVPTDREVDAFVAAVRDSGVRLTGLNFFAGDMPAGERGLVCDPQRSTELRDNVDVVVGIGEQLGCRAFNALYGLRAEDSDTAASEEAATTNLAAAAGAVARIGGTVLLEPLSGAPAYPLRTAADALSVVDRLHRHGHANLALLADLYHLAVNGDHAAAVIDTQTPRIGHLQVADAPGRGAPGTGELPLLDWVRSAYAHGYDGWVGLEYLSGDPDPFAWLDRDQRAGTPEERTEA